MRKRGAELAMVAPGVAVTGAGVAKKKVKVAVR